MRSFTDNQGRSWRVEINVAQVKRVRGLLGIDIYSLVDAGFEGLGKLLADPVAFVDLVFVLCHDEAKAAGLTDEDFGRAMAGDAIERAADAFLEELVDFFPKPRARAGLRKVMEAAARLRDATLDRLDTKLAELDLDALANSLLGSSPVSSESTHDR